MSELLSVVVNQSGFEYDIHSLVKAFYPAQDVKVFVSDFANEASTEKTGVLSGKEGAGRQEIAGSEEGLPDLQIDFDEGAIRMSVIGGNGAESDFGGYKVLLQEGMDRAQVKNCLKRLIYTGLSAHTGRQLPWGTLTGIRPTKIPMMLLEASEKEGQAADCCETRNGMERMIDTASKLADEEILAYMQETYLISEEKGRLAIEIARREKALLDTLHYEDGYSLYIGIPFCPTTCLYCSFTSYPIVSWEKRVSDYLDALEKEIDFVADFYRDKILDTIYIGGGTPTTLKAEELDRLLAKIEETLDLTHLKEFTVEAGRADSITIEKLQVLKRHGVTRISVNPQTMNQKTLDLIGRKHTVEQVKEAFAQAREAGFTNINMDIILGLPEETEEEVQYTIDEIIKLAPDSLTVHSLAVKRASKLSQWIEEKGIAMLNNTEETMRVAMEGAKKLQMVPYYLYRQKNMSGNFENVGYATEGNFGIYNILIMEEKQTILALGAGSITKRVFPDGRIERCDNVKDVGLYIEKIDEMIARKNALLRDL